MIRKSMISEWAWLGACCQCVPEHLLSPWQQWFKTRQLLQISPFQPKCKHTTVWTSLVHSMNKRAHIRRSTNCRQNKNTSNLSTGNADSELTFGRRNQCGVSSLPYCCESKFCSSPYRVTKALRESLECIGYRTGEFGAARHEKIRSPLKDSVISYINFLQFSG